MKVQKLGEAWKGAGLLTIAALLSKIIGAAYKVPLTRALGAHGMGLLQCVYPTYALMVTLSGGGLAVAVSKLTAESENKRECLRAGIILSMIVSLPLTVITALAAGAIANAVNAYEARWTLLLLISSMPLSAISAALRGYFQGRNEVRPSAVGQLIEQTAKLAAGLTLSFVLAKISVAAAVAGSAVGVLFSEIVAAVYYALAYTFRRRRADYNSDDASALKVDTSFAGIEALTEASAELTPDGAAQSIRAVTREKTPTKLIRRLIAVMLPVTLGLIVLPLCQVADSFIAVNLLKLYSGSSEEATTLYGLVTGPINTLVNLPAVFTVGLCSVLLPKVSQLKARGRGVWGTVKKALMVSLFLGAFFLVGMLIFAKLGLRILYGSSLSIPMDSAALLFRISSVSVIFIPLMQSSAAVLQGMNKAHIPALDMLVAAVVKEGLNFLLLPRMGALGFVIGYLAFYFIACTLDLTSLAIELRRDKSRARKRVL